MLRGRAFGVLDDRLGRLTGLRLAIALQLLGGLRLRCRADGGRRLELLSGGLGLRGERRFSRDVAAIGAGLLLSRLNGRDCVVVVIVQDVVTEVFGVTLQYVVTVVTEVFGVVGVLAVVVACSSSSSCSSSSPPSSPMSSALSPPS